MCNKDNQQFHPALKDGVPLLRLDEKKIRKGKPLGLPYQGSKKKVAKKIVEIIKQNFGTDKIVYDIFGGGGAITAECLINGLDVRYNDHCEFITSAFQKIISSDRDRLKTLIVSREEFFKIREKPNKTLDDEVKLLVNSFGNNRKDYLYAKSFADDKYRLAIEIIAKHGVFSGYKQTETYRNAARPFYVGWLKRLEQLERLGQLQQLQQLERLEITNKDYRAFSEVKGAVFYLDPPYENTNVRGYSDSKQFSHAEFYAWAAEMARENIVLLSSYTVSDDRFEEVFRFETAQSTLCSGRDKSRFEKLFMVTSSPTLK
jgi:site-specific DNA-adenine methylase